MIRRLVVRTHYRGLARPRTASRYATAIAAPPAVVASPASSAPSSSRGRPYDWHPDARRAAVARRAFASTGTRPAIEAKFVEKEDEQGQWWGAASDEEPQEAYRRLIDGARLGTEMAYEQGDLKGSIADALGADEADDPAGEHGPGGQGEEASADEEAEVKEPKIWRPEKLMDNTIDHFSHFLREMKGDNPDKVQLMPEWWNGKHDKALWQLAGDKDGDHFLMYSLESSDMKDLYPNISVRQKVSMMADVAKQAGPNVAVPGLSDFDDWGDADGELPEEPMAESAEKKADDARELEKAVQGLSDADDWGDADGEPPEEPMAESVEKNSDEERRALEKMDEEAEKEEIRQTAFLNRPNTYPND